MSQDCVASRTRSKTRQTRQRTVSTKMNCCGTLYYHNNPCVPFEAIAPRDGLVVEKCDECRDGYCYNMDDTADCYWCGKLVMMDGCDYFCMDCLDFCEECGTLYDRIYDEDQDKQFKLVMKSIKLLREDRNDTDSDTDPVPKVEDPVPKVESLQLTIESLQNTVDAQQHLHCSVCCVRVIRDSEQHDYCHINDNNQLICEECRENGHLCDCDFCEEERMLEDSVPKVEDPVPKVEDSDTDTEVPKLDAAQLWLRLEKDDQFPTQVFEEWKSQNRHMFDEWLPLMWFQFVLWWKATENWEEEGLEEPTSTVAFLCDDCGINTFWTTTLQEAIDEVNYGA